MRWHRLSDFVHVLVNEQDEIVASVTSTGNDLWSLGEHRQFITLEGAKAAAQKAIAVTP